MPIYTRKGDKGKTSLYGGKLVSKASLRVETYGTVDELNAVLGVVVAHLSASEKPIERLLESIQGDLLTIGSSLASPDGKSPTLPTQELDTIVKKFEEEIDLMTEEMPELHNFILPGGGKAGAFLHHSRTVARRCERMIISLSQKEAVDEAIIKYFNRLSDLLFTLARYVNQLEKKKETRWNAR
jgi:cob(I)alamin adenosyltransferase